MFAGQPVTLLPQTTAFVKMLSRVEAMVASG